MTNALEESRGDVCDGEARAWREPSSGGQPQEGLFPLFIHSCPAGTQWQGNSTGWSSPGSARAASGPGLQFRAPVGNLSEGTFRRRPPPSSLHPHTLTLGHGTCLFHPENLSHQLWFFLCEVLLCFPMRHRRPAWADAVPAFTTGTLAASMRPAHCGCSGNSR